MWAIPSHLVALVAVVFSTTVAGATPLLSTREDFRLPGTQPLAITDNVSTPDQCTPCHSNYGEPKVEPYRNWQSSMMAHAGRDPLMWAALAVSNQFVPESGETCLRCHMPKGWLEGRSLAADGSAMTAADRQGVQCAVCHRMVDPVANPGNPPEDAAILAALLEPVPAVGGAMMVIDPVEGLRGPFDIIADLGSDPHLPQRNTLVSPYHSTSELCGTCHNLRNPLFAKNDITGEWEMTPMDEPNPDPSSGFPEQSTYDEWSASAYAAGGIYAPQFGGNKSVVSTCQDCHMPDVSGRAASLGLQRDNVPLHTFAGANTFIPAILPHHPAFGSEVDPAALAAGIDQSVAMLRKAATLSGEISGGVLTIRVTNETGHKLPTGYPEGRRMWLHVRALDAQRNLLLESGRYLFGSATLSGHGALVSYPDYDPNLQVWEAQQGIDAAVAAATGLPEGKSFHLSLNNVRLKDNRIPPRGFTNVAFEALDAEPVGGVFADGQHWDEVTYPVGAQAVSAEVTLYYQTASREYVEFLRDENTTTAAGLILYDLWNEHNKSLPVAMARLTVDLDSRRVTKCRKDLSKEQAKYLKSYVKEWSRCYSRRTAGLTCDASSRDAKIAASAARLLDRIGGARDRSCSGSNLTPGSLGHGGTCPAPCDSLVLFDFGDLAACAICISRSVAADTLDAAYGARPTSLPLPLPVSVLRCQKQLDGAASGLVGKWTAALARCELANATGKNQPPQDCAADPSGAIAKAQSVAMSKVGRCNSFGGIAGCATSGTAPVVSSCVESAVGAFMESYTEVAFP